LILPFIRMSAIMYVVWINLSKVINYRILAPRLIRQKNV
jgi:hypothetical protein